MNKKTFTLAVLFLLATLAWLGYNIYRAMGRHLCVFDLVVAALFVAVAAGMVYNEFGKKKCRHLDEVNKHKIP